MRLLGVHVPGELANELVHIGLMTMICGGGAEELNQAFFNAPTLSNLYKTATYQGQRTRDRLPAARVRSDQSARALEALQRSEIRRTMSRVTAAPPSAAVRSWSARVKAWSTLRSPRAAASSTTPSLLSLNHYNEPVFYEHPSP